MSKAIKTGLMALVLLVSITTGLFADPASGVPKLWMNQEGVYIFGGNVYVSFQGGAPNDSGRCWTGGPLAGTMYLNTYTEIGKQMLSLFLSASLAGKMVSVDYTYTAVPSNDCVINSVSMP